MHTFSIYKFILILIVNGLVTWIIEAGKRYLFPRAAPVSGEPLSTTSIDFRHFFSVVRVVAGILAICVAAFLFPKIEIAWMMAIFLVMVGSLPLAFVLPRTRYTFDASRKVIVTESQHDLRFAASTEIPFDAVSKMVLSDDLGNHRVDIIYKDSTRIRKRRIADGMVSQVALLVAERAAAEMELTPMRQMPWQLNTYWERK